jgi:hypothetical protein
MDNLFPNMAILKNPHNWFLVGFALALLALISHILFRDK